MPRGAPTREIVSTLRNFRGESNARNPAQTCKIRVRKFLCCSLRSPHNAREAEAEAASAAAADDEVEFAGERTREQRDAELRARAVEVDA